MGDVVVGSAASSGSSAGPLTAPRAAVGLLTRIPVGHVEADTAGAGAFPLVGAAIGAVGLVPLVAIGDSVPVLAALLALAAMALLSGGLHLDGLADTADALMARDHEAAERARRDPGLGTGGVLALVFVVSIQAVGLAYVATLAGGLAAGLACVAAGAASRVVPVLLARLAAGRATGSGFGAWFVGRVSRSSAAAAAVAAVLVIGVVGCVGGVAVVVGGVAGCAVGVVIGLGIVRLRGQVDGDAFGASVELAVAASLVACAVLVR